MQKLLFSIIFCFIFSSCAVQTIKGKPNREVASSNLTQGEKYINSLIQDAISVYATQDFSIDVANTDEAIQYTVNFKAEDSLALYGMGGIRKRNLHVLINEQYLAIQEKIAQSGGQKFDVSKAKRIFLKFSEEE